MSEHRDQLRLLEALLFAASEPLSADDLAMRLGDSADVAALLQELAGLYAERGVNLVRLAGGWTFRTAPDLASQLKSERVVARKLSRAAVETLAIVAYHQPVYQLSLYELLSAYGEGHRRSHARVLTIEPPALHSLDDALRHLAQFVGHVPEWRELAAFLPAELRGAVFRRSALAATFAATLELTRAGRVELRQDRPFGPIYLRSPAARRSDAG